MNKAAVILAVAVLVGCQSADPAAYHHDAAHPYRITEASVRLPLIGDTPEAAAEKARSFAAERPNNGSSFIVSAETGIANAVRVALLRAGIDPRDIRVVPDGRPWEVVRTDRFVVAEGCVRVPRKMALTDYLFGTEDGFRHDGSNGELLGCSVRRNIGEMVDDPRALAGPVHDAERRGVRGQAVLDKYGKDQKPGAGYDLPLWNAGGGQ